MMPERPVDVAISHERVPQPEVHRGPSRAYLDVDPVTGAAVATDASPGTIGLVADVTTTALLPVLLPNAGAAALRRYGDTLTL